MCGIAGIWRFDGAAAGDLAAQSRAMTDAIAYRGPDGDGHWLDADVGIALGHRRLAIIDLTPTGLQPMTSADGRIVITYNGELYNRAEMAAELDRPWRGTSDTEVLVEAIAKFGIAGALARANGLFAFAAFDRGTRTLHLARDRLGIKPLYWTRQNGAFAFASELKALRAAPGLGFTLEPGAIASYLRYLYVPAPASIFREVAKLAPGHRLEATGAGVTLHRYWDLADIARRAQQDHDRRPEPELVEALHDLLADAVKRQMVSDVPLGAFLSGGIDSSAVVALMQRAASRPVKTFSIGFRERGFDEAANAKAVARHLGTDHTEVTLSAADALAIIPRLPEIYDEPFADSSQLPTFLVSRLARSQVTVALSGDGGDEVFGGYVRYLAVARIAGVARRLPAAVRRLAASAIELVSADAWDTLMRALPSSRVPAHAGDKIRKGAALLVAAEPLAMYGRVISYTPQPARFLPGVTELAEVTGRLGGETRGLDVTAQLRLLDMLTYLPDDILTKVDRASMAVSLEARVPLLDHRVVEFAWRMPAAALIAHGTGKRPLRAVLARYVPSALVDRPKMGFSIPVGDWMRGPLRPWAEDLLSPGALADGLFDAGAVRRCFAEFLAGRRDMQHGLWALLQFQAWRRAYA
ncbi:MAG TPA: asparagine synthase (glutamine-hydrolyzing) [Xanthobacteraceae bacterium]|nr:asparagine synthase (glutamine-hydrolyzing) [Xanthobacteraceae bacterium]